MIEGLKIKVTHDELRKHCMERSAYHAKRADTKDAELPQLKETMEKIKAGGGIAASALAQMNKVSSSYHTDPADIIESLEKDIRDHRNKSLVFRFFGEHLFPEDYTLQEADLTRLEIVSRW